MRYGFVTVIYNSSEAQFLADLNTLGQRGFHIVATLGEAQVLLQREVCDPEPEFPDQAETSI